MTFSVTSEIEMSFKLFKKMFYDSSQSDMIRTLLSAGTRVLEAEKTAKGDDEK